MKKIVLLSDGTGNSSASPQKTNVWRAYQALDRSEEAGQIAYYDNGVGTSPFRPAAVLGLAFGWGLARNVRDMYKFLCETYDPGDEIYCFGFSRGAFTIRVATALIASQGIIERNRAGGDLDRLVVAAYRRFRQESFSPSFLSLPLAPIRDFLTDTWHRARGRTLYDPKKNLRYADTEVLINFVGVWDTVDAYGLPVDELTRAWDRVVWPLTAKDRDLSPRVARACQALALDEQRESFEPMLWNEGSEKPDDCRLLQVWFPGVHSNVGGSYPDDGVALEALNWMLDESTRNAGLTYLESERRRFAEQADRLGPLFDSRRGVGAIYRYAPRNLDHLCHEEKPGLGNTLKGFMPRISEMFGADPVERNEVEIARPKIHHSVFERMQRSGNAYAPINLPEDYALVDASGGVIDPPEKPQAAKARLARQSHVWIKVWQRKVLYFTTLAAMAYFVFYPYIGNGNYAAISNIFEPVFGTLAEPMRAVPMLIGAVPGLGFAENWAIDYSAYPIAFLLFIVVIVGLLLLSAKIGAAITTEMQAIWRTPSGGGSASGMTAPERPSGLAGFLEGPAYRQWIARPLRIVLEIIAIVFLLALLGAIVLRVLSTSADGFGVFCKKASDAALIELKADGGDGSQSEIIVFDPRNPCFDTGIKLTRGRKYVVELALSEGWKDAGISADMGGWIEPPWALRLVTPLRRHIFVDWYQPVARIGGILFDRYPLPAADVSSRSGGAPWTRLHAEIKARRDGRLYLYLNDLMLLTPYANAEIYGNNNGHACLRVTRIPDKPDRAKTGPGFRSFTASEKGKCQVPPA